MCIVIDTNCFHPVFNTANQKHSEFRPVLMWIVDGEGKIVFGGSKYKSELARTPKILRFFLQLKRARKLVEVDQVRVDQWQAKVERILDPRKHNDPHLPAIVSVSGCRLICTEDKKSFALLKDRRCYPKRVSRPSIYSGARNQDLLCARYIADICR